MFCFVFVLLFFSSLDALSQQEKYSLDSFKHQQQTYALDALTNCLEVPARNFSQIQQVSVKVKLDPTHMYTLHPAFGANMYWPGNNKEPYDHFAWAIACTPESCGMGSVCGSSDPLTCCQYSTLILGVPPPNLHFKNPNQALFAVHDAVVHVSGQPTLYCWIEDDNCSNNHGKLGFNVTLTEQTTL